MTKKNVAVVADAPAAAPKKRYVLIRTRSAGVFTGYLLSKTDLISGVEVELSEARRIWYWDGAASLSQLAIDGTSKPENCKFPVALPYLCLPETIEIIDVTEKARKSIEGVPVWSA